MKTFIEWLKINESMDVYIQDFDYRDNIRELDDLSNYLKNKVLWPLEQHLTPEDKEQIGKAGPPIYDILAPDGSYYENGDLVLNFYTQSLPKHIVDKALQGIRYYLDEMKVKYSMTSDRSKMYGGDVVRIKIDKVPTSENIPPTLTLSNANARLIFGEMLGYPDEERGFSNINARDLLMRISRIGRDELEIHQRDPYSTQQPRKSKVSYVGLMADDIQYRLGIIKQIAQWAIDHHYDILYVTSLNCQ